MPSISVIVAAYNKQASIPKTLESLMNQTFRDFEIILVDDGSTDQTGTVAAQWESPLLHYYYQENKGVTAARNKGVELSRGRYLTFLDADDWVAPDWLEQFYRLLQTEQFDIVFCDVEVIDQLKKSSKRTKARFPYRGTIEDRNGLFLTGAFCVQRTFFIQLGQYDPKIRFGENAELSFRFQLVRPRTGFTDQTGLFYEITGTGGGKNYRNKIEDTLYIIQKHPVYFQQDPHALRVYYQSVAIAYQKLNHFGKAVVYFIKAWIVQPAHVRHLLQAVRALLYLFLPFLHAQK